MSDRPAPPPETSTLVPGGDTFPGGSAVVALGVWFLLKRVAVRPAATQVALNVVAGAAGAVGALFAAGGTLLYLVRAARSAEGPTARAIAWARVVFAAPVALLVLFALHSDAPGWVQWAALGGAAATVAGSLGGAAVRAGVSPLARVTLALLCVGQLVELATPVAQAGMLFEPPAHGGPMRTLGALSELCTLVGAWLALGWSVRATMRTAGWARARMFTPMPVFVGVVLSVMTLTLQPRLVSYVALGAFGTRFDLARVLGLQGPAPKAVLLIYLFAPVALLGASVISVGGVLADRGASARRVLGWALVVMAGFGALRLAGPVDPLRTAVAVFACVLLGEAAVLEAREEKG